ncbi:hypothetical protein SAMN05444972_107152 [Marininema halotolerans]|uniref:Uncharacterized protein n=1 Tax=Marininema halotolerans TaxID=1155944 RepID=A0A1I6SJX0_9BACL|nr:hypothetical protein SAMN05444972_107152 [Marininema halotolerans]
MKTNPPLFLYLINTVQILRLLLTRCQVDSSNSATIILNGSIVE